MVQSIVSFARTFELKYITRFLQAETKDIEQHMALFQFTHDASLTTCCSYT